MLRVSELDISVSINIVTSIADFGLTENRDSRMFKLNVMVEAGNTSDVKFHS
jgi:hypothetical protein